ncbi:MAG: hypothetical protein V1808_00695 [Candidatus Daviesbacteria bacterium]
MRHAVEAKQFLGVINGAIHGRPYLEVTPVFSPSEFPKQYPPNPKTFTLVQELRTIMGIVNMNHTQRELLPWSNEKVEIHSLFRSLVTFTDDHDGPINNRYFPVNNSSRFIDRIMETSRLEKNPLNLPRQLEIALEITDRQAMASVIICHSASRAIGRNRDQRVDPCFKFSSEDMQQWGSSIARFEDNKQYDPPGDTYHFWATLLMGMTLRRSFTKQPAECVAYAFLFYYGADIMAASRRFLARNPLVYRHKEVDRMGLKIGWNLGA